MHGWISGINVCCYFTTNAYCLTTIIIVDLKFSSDFNCRQLVVWLKQEGISGDNLKIFEGMYTHCVWCMAADCVLTCMYNYI